MTTHDQKVVKSGQTHGFIETWTSDPSIDGKLFHKFICVIFEYDILRLMMTTRNQKSGQTHGLIEKWTSNLGVCPLAPLYIFWWSNTVETTSKESLKHVDYDEKICREKFVDGVVRKRVNGGLESSYVIFT